jgi:hypothetical protein
MKTRTLREFIAEVPQPGFYWVYVSIENFVGEEGWEPALLEVPPYNEPSYRYNLQLLGSDEGFGHRQTDLDNTLVGDKIEVPK